jgi:ankyrin repeat protein
MLAASEGHEATVRVLLDIGKAQVKAKNNNGSTALMLAASKGHEATVRLLRVATAL